MTLSAVYRIILPLLGAFVVTKLLNHFLDNERLNGKLNLILLKSLLSAGIWAAAIVFSLSFFSSFSRGWETALAGSGIVAVIIGLAAQETLGNVFAGIAMSTSQSRPFDIGDRVRIGDAEPGFVKDITLRHVVLVTYLNSTIYIPNSVVGKSLVTNYTTQEAFGYPIEVWVAYDSDIDRAIEIMRDVILSHETHHGEDNVNILCKECGSSGVLLKGVVTTRDFMDNQTACSDCLLDIIRRYRKEGIEIPYNKMEIVQIRTKDR